MAARAMIGVSDDCCLTCLLVSFLELLKAKNVARLGADGILSEMFHQQQLEIILGLLDMAQLLWIVGVKRLMWEG